MRQTLRTLQRSGARLTGSARAGQPQRKPTTRTGPAQPQQHNNQAFSADEEDDDEHWPGGDELQSRGFDQYPDQPRWAPRSGGSARTSACVCAGGVLE